MYEYKKINFNFYYPYNSYWYLLCLIYWRFSIQYFANQYFPITISFIISILVGFWKEIDSVFSIKKVFFENTEIPDNIKNHNDLQQQINHMAPGIADL